MSGSGYIRVRGARVHNLKNIDVDIPRGKLVVLCGLSGSGKSSLAIDTLYAEGQRRYLETFSAYTRQFLERLEKPDADLIDGIPPSLAVTGRQVSRSTRSTVGTATEITNYLRLLYAKIGSVFCHRCGCPVRRHTPETVARELLSLPSGTRLLVAFRPVLSGQLQPESLIDQLRSQGFIRVIADGQILRLDQAEQSLDGLGHEQLLVVVDRLKVGAASEKRVRESLETAFAHGDGNCVVLHEAAGQTHGHPAEVMQLGDNTWVCRRYSNRMRCELCGKEYFEPEPRLFSFNSPLGACPACEGFGNVIDVDMDLVVPDPSKSIREGAIAPWNCPAYCHELEELLDLADDYGIPVDIPFSELKPEHLDLIVNGVPERHFGGLRGFFAWLERRKYKMHIRVFLSRWRSYRTCEACGGARLRPEALAVKVGGKNIAEVSAMPVAETLEFFRNLTLKDWEQDLARMILEQITARLSFMIQVGLGYLTLDRLLRTLSGGEARRVALTAALGSNLINMLYVLDEPSVGLHPHDIDRLVQAILRLRDRGNTVLVVEHEEAVIRAADQVIEIGPGAGERGGQIVFQGTPKQLLQSKGSLTGEYLSGQRSIPLPSTRRQAALGWIRLVGARGNNLKNVTVEFPLGVLCLVTGVSGSGKSTLVHDTLFPALCRKLGKEAPKPLPYDELLGYQQLNDVVLVDQTPLARSSRSNPVTYLKIFDEIRRIFAKTPEAKRRGLSASYFSFNAGNGRCPACQGEGFLEIDMQFLADVYMRCPQCNGSRYKKDLLEVTYRGRNIAQVLDMTAEEAFAFFRGEQKVQSRLSRLLSVGLGYLRLGQPLSTLSVGEAQRLKLAAYLLPGRRGHCLFVLDEPTTGLHYADIEKLLKCFDALVSAGHSLIVIEHNLHVIKAADYIIDLGPGAADEGGTIVATGPPERIANHPQSITGRYLRSVLQP